MELKDKKINFLGDSITEGHGASAEDKHFTSLIEKKTGAICRNYGIGGTRIARQVIPSENPRYDLDFCMRAEEMDADADIVVVFGGTNDFGHGDAALGKFEDRTLYTFYGALHSLYTLLINKYNESTIVILTPIHRINEDESWSPNNEPEALHPLKDYVNAIREVAEYYSLPVLDLYATSGLQPEIPIIKEKYMPDGLHPSDAGYKILANKITAFLEQTAEFK